MSTSYSPSANPEIDLSVDETHVNRLVIHNDHVNTFEWVIETLIEVCKHTQEQAEQCSYIIHSKGKYAVKRGSFNYLKPMKEAIAERGINVTID